MSIWFIGAGALAPTGYPEFSKSLEKAASMAAFSFILHNHPYFYQ
jgi:hypothetical protein